MFSTCAFLFMWLVGHLLLYFQVALDVYCFCRLDSPSGRGFLLFLSRLVGYIVDAKCLFVVAVQWLGLVWLFVTPWTAAHQASLSFTISWSLLKLVSIESVMSFNYLILFHPLLLLPSVFPSIKVFSSELTLRIRGPEYWSFSISPSKECLLGWVIL